MSATNTFEDGLLSLIFANANLANVGDATGLRASTTAGQLFVSLHTSALADTDASQATNEGAYTSYGRVGVARSSGGWTVASGNVDNAAAITFPACTGGTETEVDFGIGFATSGATALHVYGSLTSSLAVSTGITPEFAIGALDISIN